MSRIREIIAFAEKNPDLAHRQIADHFKIERSIVHHALNSKLKEREDEVLKLYKADPTLSNTHIARLLKISRQSVAVILDKHGCRESKVSSIYKDPVKWETLYNLLETTDLNCNGLAEAMGISVPTFEKFIRYHNYDLKARSRRIRIERTTADKMVHKWPEILKLLDESDIPMQTIATKFKMPYNEFKRLCEMHNYETNSRKRRLVSNTKPVPSHEKFETMDGKGLSTLAHRLPLNRIAEVFR